MRANAAVEMVWAKPRSSTDAGMTVTPAADAANIVPTIEGFRRKLPDLTTRNYLLKLSLKSQRTAQILSNGHINQACFYPLLSVLANRAKRVIKLVNPNESRQIQPKPNRGTCIFFAAIDTQKDELWTIKAKLQQKGRAW